MATKKSSSTKSSQTKSSSSSKWGLNKISMYVLVAVALLYVVSLLLACFDVNLVVVSALQGVAAAVMVVIVSILAWRYVKPKQAVWKVLYILCLLLVLVGIVVPLVLQ